MALFGLKTAIYLTFISYYTSTVRSFDITHYSPNKVVECLNYIIHHNFDVVLHHFIQTEVEGSVMELMCESDNFFEYCTWYHLNDSCSFNWEPGQGEDPQKEKCSNTLKNQLR